MSPLGARRRSIDSSDSSDSDSDSGKDYHKKDKKDKKDKDKKKDKKDKDKKEKTGHPTTSQIDHNQARFHTSQIMSFDQDNYQNQFIPQHGGGFGGSSQPPLMPHPSAFDQQIHLGGHGQQYGGERDVNSPPSGPPPNYSAPQSAPPSGFRLPLTTDAPFPPPEQTGRPVAYDLDGSPIFIGSALFPSSVHPCKIGPNLSPYVAVPYGGQEHNHHGRYDLLPFDERAMEWVPTRNGQVPLGRRPIEGGYEEGGQKLYHALGNVQGVKVPGKTGEHLGGANLSFGGGEHVVTDYSILCWR